MGQTIVPTVMDSVDDVEAGNNPTDRYCRETNL